jgi:integrase
LLKSYLRAEALRFGPLFRAQKNYQGGALRYQSAQALWTKYCQAVGISCSLHQLRHAHATELVNEGVSLSTIRKRLGHKNLQTTLRYAQQSDTSADAEIRAWRRKKRH